MVNVEGSDTSFEAAPLTGDHQPLELYSIAENTVVRRRIPTTMATRIKMAHLPCRPFFVPDMFMRMDHLGTADVAPPPPPFDDGDAPSPAPAPFTTPAPFPVP